MSDTTLGQIAWEAWSTSEYDDPSLAEHWPTDDAKSWQAAAEAAVSTFIENDYAKWKALIEAAKKLERLLGDAYIPPGKTWDAWEQFTLAVEALEEVERE